MNIKIDEDGTKTWFNHLDQEYRVDGPAVEYSSGAKKWYLNGQLHRTDGPAIDWSDGHKEWYLNGQLHRTDGPAVELPDGYKKWYLNGLRHRTDGPAVEFPDGTKFWYLNDLKHRTDGPAVELPDSYKKWYLNDQLHRTDGPAIEHPDGYKAWYLNGLRHRTDGPAVEFPDGTKKWYLNGQQLSFEEWLDRTKQKACYMKITAAQARELSGPTPQERVDAVYPLIREGAEKGQRSIRIGVDFWALEGYKNSAAYKEAVRLLEADGYTVKFYCEERQFGTEIRW